MKLIRNGLTLLQNPKLFGDYYEYQVSKWQNKGEAVRLLPDDIRIVGLSGFSEFHSCTHFVSDAERIFLNHYSLTDGDLIDVGANLGVVSLILAKRFFSRKVHSFEPNPSTFSSLKKNTELNKCNNVLLQNIVVADHNGEIAFNADPTYRGTTSISQEGEHLINLPCITLDNYAKSHSIENISFLKVDVEGYEELVFSGAIELLREKRVNLIYYEVCPNNAKKAGLDPKKPTQILLDHGYSIYKLIENGSLVEGNISQIDSVILDNWLAICPK
ncbi:FkbM family methyltransferase [Anabaena sp. CS-542/02]|uniref:FkbM family methyltransferase n=1 Tax=Anabaena sp. CS-542/02 TaxID=3021719 RepID=UPI00232EA7E6|nr:FkbM family methyltransferase [Anabaena sp. CS-542/02]MDB9446463.1 FkbM family methyltransferase [Anabaena sp. CS-542/02]